MQLEIVEELEQKQESNNARIEDNNEEFKILIKDYLEKNWNKLQNFELWRDFKGLLEGYWKSQSEDNRKILDEFIQQNWEALSIAIVKDSETSSEWQDYYFIFWLIIYLEQSI